ncbi:MAG: MerR family transcriptional regulator [Bdellovibrionales bacterium]|nr:MerR family transcriptional regulator [Ramlibacter sp.]
MSGVTAAPSGTLPISAVERDTGLSKDTLRVWERRYGFPLPERDPAGDRAYTAQQIDKLRTIKRLLDRGHRPGRIVSLELAELQRILGGGAANEVRPATHGMDFDAVTDLVRTRDVRALRRHLNQAAGELGLARFVVDVVAPLNARVADSCDRGLIEMFEERLYTESVAAALHHAMHGMAWPAGQARPRVLLTGLHQESHDNGVLMAEAMYGTAGCLCLPLGPRNHVYDIVRAATALGADIVSVTCGAGCPPAQLHHALAELRARLPASTAIWAGGESPALGRRPVRGVLVLPQVDSMLEEVTVWRLAHPAPSAAAA